MKAEPASRSLVVMVISMIAIMLAIPSHSYNRERAVEYALRWSEDTGDANGIANTLVYKNFVDPPYNRYDCANFVSQCLIEGGTRFRSSTDADDNVKDPWIGSEIPELETGVGTVSIKSANLKEYSRTVTSANELPTALKHPRHGGGSPSGSVPTAAVE